MLLLALPLTEEAPHCVTHFGIPFFTKLELDEGLSIVDDSHGIFPPRA